MNLLNKLDDKNIARKPDDCVIKRETLINIAVMLHALDQIEQYHLGITLLLSRF